MSLWRAVYFSWWLNFSFVLAVFSLQKCAFLCMWGRSWDRFSIVPGSFKLSGFLWHCSKWACQFIFRILQYMPGLTSVCSINTDLRQNLNLFSTWSDIWNGHNPTTPPPKSLLHKLACYTQFERMFIFSGITLL